MDDYPNNMPGEYTVHIQISAGYDAKAVQMAAEIMTHLMSRHFPVQQMHLTDADDWAESVSMGPGGIQGYRNGTGDRQFSVGEDIIIGV